MISTPSEPRISQRCELASRRIYQERHANHCTVSAADSDISFQSSDGVIFEVHRKNLDTHSEGFSPPGGTIAPTQLLVQLPEREETLDLLFQFMYPQRQPNLKRLEFASLSALAEAAEKYQVFSALDICGVHMRFVVTTATLKILTIYCRSALESHTLEVLAYAAKHGYSELVEEACLRYLPTTITTDPLATLECSLRYNVTQLVEPAAKASLGTPITTVFETLPSQYFVAWVRTINNYFRNFICS